MLRQALLFILRSDGYGGREEPIFHLSFTVRTHRLVLKADETQKKHKNSMKNSDSPIEKTQKIV